MSGAGGAVAPPVLLYGIRMRACVQGRCAEAPLKGTPPGDTASAGWPPATKPQDPAWEYLRLRGLGHRYRKASRGFRIEARGIGADEVLVCARVRADGTVVRVLPDGREEPFPRDMPTREMTEEGIEAAALSDPDAQPLTEVQLAQARQVLRVKTLCRALRVTQEEFATRFGLSLATVRDWEQGRTQPDQAASTYLEVIARAPDAVMAALGTAPAVTAER